MIKKILFMAVVFFLIILTSAASVLGQSLLNNFTLTSNVLPAPYVANCSSAVPPNYDCYKAFDKIVDSIGGDNYWQTGSGGFPPAWIWLDLGSGNETAVTQYSIDVYNGSGSAAYYPTEWTFQGSNDSSSWYTLDSHTGYTWTAGGFDNFTIANTDTYRFYKLDVTSGQHGSILLIEEIELFANYSVPNVSFFTVTAQDYFDTTALNNFTVEVNNTNYTTTTGTVTTIITDIDPNLYDVFIFDVNNSGGYYNRSYSNVNISSNLLGRFWQAELWVNATEIMTDNSIEGTFNISGNENATNFYIKAGTYNITFVNSSYHTQTQEYTITALSNNTATIENVSNMIINITARHVFGNSSITGFEGFTSENNGLVNVSWSTATTFYEFYGLQGYNYSTVVMKENYTDSGAYYTTATVSLHNVTAYLYALNSFLIEFYDEITNVLLNETTVSLELISTVFSGNYTATNGTLYVTVLDPANYTARYSAVDYQERFYYFNLANNSYFDVDLYLLNQSFEYNVTVNVIDQNAALVEGAIVKALRYNLITNSYLLVSMSETDVNGNALLQTTFNDEFYKFVVELNGVTLATTTPTYITTNLYSIQIIIGEAVLENYEDWSSLSGVLTFNNVTNNFRFVWSDANGVSTNVNMRTYRMTSGGLVYINSTISTAASGTMLHPVNAINGTTYVSKVYFTDSDGVEYLLDQELYEFFVTNVFGDLGLFIQIVITLVLVFLFFWNPALASILVPASLLLGRIINLTALPLPALIVLQVVGILIAFMLTER